MEVTFFLSVDRMFSSLSNINYFYYTLINKTRWEERKVSKKQLITFHKIQNVDPFISFMNICWKNKFFYQSKKLVLVWNVLNLVYISVNFHLFIINQIETKDAYLWKIELEIDYSKKYGFVNRNFVISWPLNFDKKAKTITNLKTTIDLKNGYINHHFVHLQTHRRIEEVFHSKLKFFRYE